MATKVKPVGVAEGNWWQSAFISASQVQHSSPPRALQLGVFPERLFSVGKCVDLKGGDVALVTLTM